MRTTLLMLPGALLRRIQDDCESRRPDEACGVLVGVISEGVASVAGVVALANVWAEPAERPVRYAVDPLAQMRAERQAAADGMDVVGFYHSHPTGRAVPSGVDAEMAWPGYVYLIVGFAPEPAARAWTLNDDGRGFSEIRVDADD